LEDILNWFSNPIHSLGISSQQYYYYCSTKGLVGYFNVQDMTVVSKLVRFW